MANPWDNDPIVANSSAPWERDALSSAPPTRAGSRVRTRFGYGVVQDDGSVLGDGVDGEFSVDASEIIGADARPAQPVRTNPANGTLRNADARSLTDVFLQAREDTARGYNSGAIVRAGAGIRGAGGGTGYNPTLDITEEARRRASRDTVMADDRERFLGVPTEPNADLFERLVAGLTPNPKYTAPSRMVLADVNPFEAGNQPLNVEGPLATVAHVAAAGAGSLVGGLQDPVNSVLGAGANRLKGLVPKLAAQGGQALGQDAATQAADVSVGLQGEYDPARTAAAGVAGTALQAAFELPRALSTPRPTPVTPEPIPPARQLIDNSDRINQGYDPRPEPVYPPRLAPPRPVDASTPLREQPPAQSPARTYRVRRNGEDVEVYISKPMSGSRKTHTVTPVSGGPSFPVRPDRLQPVDTAAGRRGPVLTSQHYDYRGQRVVVEKVDGETATVRTLEPDQQGPARIRGVPLSELQATTDASPAQRDRPTSFSGEMAPAPEPRDPDLIEGPQARAALPAPERYPSRYPNVADPVRDRLAANANTASAREGGPSDAIPLNGRERTEDVATTRTYGPPADGAGTPANDARPRPALATDNPNPRAPEPPAPEPVTPPAPREEAAPRTVTNGSVYAPGEKLSALDKANARNYGYEPAIWRQLKPEERANILKTPPDEWLKLKPAERAARAQGPAPVAPDDLRGRQTEGPVMPKGVKPITAQARPSRPAAPEMDGPDVPLGNYRPPEEAPPPPTDVPLGAPGEQATPPRAQGSAAIDAVRASLERNLKRLEAETNPDVKKGIQKVIDLQRAKLAEAGADSPAPKPAEPFDFAGQGARNVPVTTRTGLAKPEPKTDAEMRLLGPDGKPLRGSRDEIIDYLNANNLPDRFQPQLDLDREGNFFTIVDADAKRAARIASEDGGPEGPTIARITNEPETPKAKPAPEDKPLGPREARDVTPQEMARGEGNFSVTDRRRMQRRVDEVRAKVGLEPLRETPRDVVEGPLVPVDARNTLTPSDNPYVRPNFEDNVDTPGNSFDQPPLVPVEDMKPAERPVIEDLQARYDVAEADLRSARSARQDNPNAANYAREAAALKQLDDAGRALDAELERQFPAPPRDDAGDATVNPTGGEPPARRGPDPQSPRAPADTRAPLPEETRRNMPGADRIAESETTKNFRRIVENTRTDLKNVRRELVNLRKREQEYKTKPNADNARGLQKVQLNIDRLTRQENALKAALARREARLAASQAGRATEARSIPALDRAIEKINQRMDDIARDIARNKTRYPKGTPEYQRYIENFDKARTELMELMATRRDVVAEEKAALQQGRKPNLLDDESGELKNPFRKRTPAEIEQRNADIDAAVGDDKARKRLIAEFTDAVGTSRVDRTLHNAILFFRGGDVANLRELARRHPELKISPEVAKQMGKPEAAGMNHFTWAADQIGTDPGSRRVVGQQVENAISQRAAIAVNKLEDIFADDVPRAKTKAEREARARAASAEREAVRRWMTVDRVARSPAEVAAAERMALDSIPADRRARVVQMAEAAQAWFKEHREYLVDAGVTVGNVRDYLNRIVDERAVRRNPEGFVKLLKEQYLADDVARGHTGKDALEPAVAELQARAVLDRILYPYSAKFAGDLNLPDPLPKSTKARVLSSTADKRLAPFYIRDPEEAMKVYAQRMATAAEQTRRFGPRGEVLQALFDDLKTKVPEESYSLAHNAVETGRGVNSVSRSVQSEAINGAMSWVQTAGILRVLGRTATFQTAEPLLIAARLNKSLLTAGAAWARQWDQLAADITHPLTGENLGWGTKGAREGAQIARAIGVTGALAREITLDAVTQGKGRKARALTSLFLKMQFTASLTHQQRVVAIRMAEPAFRSAIDDIASNKPNSAPARALMGEYGVDDASAKRLSKWLQSMDDVDFTTRLERITDEKSPEAAHYRAMLADFAKKAVVEPTAADLPTLAKNPYTRAAYGIASFQAAFTREHRNRAFRQFATSLDPKNKLSAGERLVFANSLLNLVAVYAPALALLQYLRETQFSTSASREDMDVIDRVRTSLSASGLFGNADPLVNMIFPKTRYSTNANRLVGSDYLMMDADRINTMIGGTPWSPANTPNNNTAENNAAAAAYSQFAAPAIAAGTTLLTPGPLRPAAGVANMYATSSKTAKGFADLVVGPKGTPTQGPDESDYKFSKRQRTFEQERDNPDLAARRAEMKARRDEIARERRN